MFPKNYKKPSGSSENINIALFGDRILSDQTLYEYLIEFLQVFISAKNDDGSGKQSFHSCAQIDEGNLKYYVDLQVALRRFIFYNRSKQESRSAIDTIAYDALEELLYKAAQNNKMDIDLIRDLLLNYSIVTRNRGWYVQSLMPVAPELILAELQGIKARQKIAHPDINSSDVDGLFDYSKHNFLARGGQVLYLHLLQGLSMRPESEADNRDILEKLLRNMFECSGAGIGTLAYFIQNEWVSARLQHGSAPKEYLAKTFNMTYITDDFRIRSVRFVDEVMTFLSANIHPIARIELFAQGIVLSLLRVMQLIADKKIGKTNGEPTWIMDMSRLGGTSNIGKISAQSYSSAYDTFQSALLKVCAEMNIAEEDRYIEVQKAKKDSSDVFKRLGKELKLIIPPHGNYERFSLSESLVRYLVLALVRPGTKITFDTFLAKLYEHFGMIIAPETYRTAVASGALKGNEDMANYFQINAKAFQEFLKQCGFLRDLSDATAIVENPYSAVRI